MRGGAIRRTPQCPEGMYTSTRGFAHMNAYSHSFLCLVLPVFLFSPSLMHPNTQTGPEPQAGAGTQLLSLLHSD